MWRDGKNEDERKECGGGVECKCAIAVRRALMPWYGAKGSQAESRRAIAVKAALGHEVSKRTARQRSRLYCCRKLGL